MANRKQSRSRFKDQTKNFWVSNISNKDVTLSDLALTIPSRQSYDLLSKGFYFTEKQLEESAESGSLWTKRDKIKMGITHREIPNPIKYELSTQPIQVRKRTAVVLKEPEFSDWLYSDDEFADEMSDDEE